LEEEREEQRNEVVVLPPLPGAEETADSSLSGGTQSGTGASAATPAGAQAGASTANMPAAAQSGTPGVPTAAAGPQGAAAGAPGTTSAAQAGSSTLKGVTNVAGHGLRYKLLGTVAGKIITAVLAVTVVAAGAGAVVYAALLPRPVLTVTSSKHVNGTPAAGLDGVLHVSGQKFSANSTITFLLDGKPAPDADTAKIDKNGAVKADLTITEDWLLGRHTLTARDAKNYVTNDGTALLIVPAPVLSVFSGYQSGAAASGGVNTIFHVSGKGFAYHSTITFLLDGQPVPGSQTAESNERGRVQADLTATGDWTLGNHTLTAKDAQGDAPQTGATIAIVTPGEGGTPGPNGAPANDTSFTIQATEPNWEFGVTSYATLVITGKAGGDSGTVCGPSDTGQSMTSQEMPNTGPGGGTFHDVTVYTCSGSYKSGMLTYTETITSDMAVFSAGFTCVESTPFVLQSLTGVFSSATQISGTWYRDAITQRCTRSGFGGIFPGGQGTWTGTAQG
jgi:hypothetical protein